jgi:hypothetical protein
MSTYNKYRILEFGCCHNILNNLKDIHFPFEIAKLIIGVDFL